MSLLARFFLLGFFLLTGSLTAFAEGPVSVRTGDHDKYSRIVFEWSKLKGYKVEKQGTEGILVTFSEAAKAPSEKIEAFNILGFTVVSANPFSAKLSIPSGAAFRYFGAGERLIIDIYDAPDRDRPPPPPPPPGEKENPPKPTDEPELGKIIKPETRPVAVHDKQAVKEEPAKEMVVKEAIGVAKPADSQLMPPEKKPDNPAPALTAETKADASAHSVKQDFVPKDNLISVSATQSVGLAAFESAGQILMVFDVPDVLVKPQVSGANAGLIEPVQSFEVEKGKGFKASALPGTKLRAEGGGLLWSVIITPKTEELENAAIERKPGSIFVPLKNIRNQMDVLDPQTGAALKVITVTDAESRVGDARAFVDFDILASAAGLAIRPKVDGLEVKVVPEGVEISKPGGLILSAAEDIKKAEDSKTKPKTQETPPPMAQQTGQILFDFKEWRMGGMEKLDQNRNILFNNMHGKTKDEQISDLIKLARMQIANGRGAEALGFLRFAGQELPELEQNPEFLALRAVSKAFDGKFETALEDLSSPILADFSEIKIWKAYVLASLGDWSQAKETLPDDLTVLKNYTPEILNRLALVLAEIELRDGDIEIAEELFTLVEADKAQDNLNKAIGAQLEYLKGEAARQKGKIDDTIKLWEPLTKGPDTLYRVKTGLALTRLLVENKKITASQAIDRLERLRYAWRGDELEAQVNYWLGRTYFESGDTIKGLKILREAIPFAKDTPLAPRIASDMVSLYTGYFTSPDLAKVNPVDAMALYEEFHDLLPKDDVGNKVMKALAERLVSADLLTRGANLLQSELDRLQGDEAAHTAVRLAAIYLLDKNPDKALKALEKASGVLKTLPPEVANEARFSEVELLRARALSQGRKPDQALGVLAAMKQGADVNRLRADIAWQAGYWDDASYALQDVIDDEDIKLTRPLTDPQAAIILQRALALNLSGDRIGLAEMREKYTEAMSQTSKAKQFEVVTRARQNAGLADRDTLLSAVSEVDLFKGFLESYKKEAQPSN